MTYTSFMPGRAAQKGEDMIAYIKNVALSSQDGIGLTLICFLDGET